MKDVKELVESYEALWNERSEDIRRRRIAELWTEDGAHFSQTLEVRGHAAIESRIAAAHARFVDGGKYVFRAIDNIVSHHDTIRFYWTMAPANGGDVESVGLNFLILAPDGRIREDYQFIEP
jgi:hypothetical protein